MLFFPGLSDLGDRLAAGTGRSGRARALYERAFVVDHASLEPDRTTWHMTQRKASGKRVHQGGGRTVPIGQGRVLWFGLMATGLSDFRGLRARTVARMKSPPNDQEVNRRLATFDSAIAASQIAVLPVPVPPKDHLLFFQVVAGQFGAPDFEGPVQPPGKIPFVRLDPVTGFQAKHVRAQLSADIEIQILAGWLPGVCQRGVTFTWTGPDSA